MSEVITIPQDGLPPRDWLAEYFLSERDENYIEPLYLTQHKARIQEIKDEYEYNVNPDNIPTWASPELAFEMWKEKNKIDNPKPTFVSWLRKIFS